jgi:hypothetical protein
MLRELHELPRKCEQEDDERQGEFTRAARGTKFDPVAYLLLRPTMRIGRTTLRDLINAGGKTCNGLHTEILRGEQVEHMMALLARRSPRRAAALLDDASSAHQRPGRPTEEGLVEIEGGGEASMWLLYSADSKTNSIDKVTGFLQQPPCSSGATA